MEIVINRNLDLYWPVTNLKNQELGFQKLPDLQKGSVLGSKLYFKIKQSVKVISDEDAQLLVKIFLNQGIIGFENIINLLSDTKLLEATVEFLLQKLKEKLENKSPNTASLAAENKITENQIQLEKQEAENLKLIQEMLKNEKEEVYFQQIESKQNKEANQDENLEKGQNLLFAPKSQQPSINSGQQEEEEGDWSLENIKANPLEFGKLDIQDQKKSLFQIMQHRVEIYNPDPSACVEITEMLIDVEKLQLKNIIEMIENDDIIFDAIANSSELLSAKQLEQFK